ncbi:GDSL-type esterase/lipase family protein [Frigoribacterium sp. ACAM 257]|uniref:GDSL-type esterase/lipase family protein n=1 Tax=Frigoribacterium sp. ACAM 257 TaxID=2508998 RepID=UPI00174C214E|nr:GDSL-type esterase/lipase family protein [Frigoribacterium sp. ACAM 257]
MTTLVAGLASGVRLEFVTAASLVEVKLKFTRLHVSLLPDKPSPACLGVVADGRDQLLYFDEGAFMRLGADMDWAHVDGAATKARIELDSVTAPRSVTVWMPPDAAVELLAIRADAPLIAPPHLQRTWVHYGSSISHGSDMGPFGPWPVITSRLLELDVTNLGLSGSAHLDGFAARTIRAANAEIITLELGINVVDGGTMTTRTFGPAVHAFIDTLRETHETTPIVVISPIFCPVLEDTPGPAERSPEGKVVGSSLPSRSGDGRLTLRLVRDVLENIVNRRSIDDAHLHYIDGLTLLGASDGHHLTDNLHPDAAGHRLIGKRFAEVLRDI